MTPLLNMTAHAAKGHLALQRCTACGSVQYPPRELCVACLADTMEWCVTADANGEVLASTELHHSHAPAFRERLPLRVGLVRLDAGPAVVCFLTDGCAPGIRVHIAAQTDADGRPVLTAIL